MLQSQRISHLPCSPLFLAAVAAGTASTLCVTGRCCTTGEGDAEDEDEDDGEEEEEEGEELSTMALSGLLLNEDVAGQSKVEHERALAK